MGEFDGWGGLGAVAAVWLVAPFYVFWDLRRTRRYRAHLRVAGVVSIAVVLYSKKESDESTETVYGYEADGRRLQFRGPSSVLGRDARPGDRLTVDYDPEFPDVVGWVN
jgi:hypothetical protein